MSTAPHRLDRVELSNPYATAGRSNQPEIDSEDNKTLKVWVWMLAICCVVAIGISGYLTWVSFTSSKIAGCGGGVFDCSHVTNSKWSMWMGLPVSLLAIGSYLSLATALVFALLQGSPAVKRCAWTAVAIFALSAGLAAVWFIGLQHFVLEHYCSYCLVAHACGIVAAGIAVWKIPNSKSVLKFAAPVAAIGIAVLVTGQIYQSEPEKFRFETFEAVPFVNETFDAPFLDPTENASEGSDVSEGAVFEAPVVWTEKVEATRIMASLFSAKSIAALVRPATAMLALTSPLQSGNSGTAGSGAKAVSDQKSETKKPQTKSKKRRTVGINGGTIKLDVAQWPLSGSVDAKHVFVEMLDYNCPNCRKTHKAVSGAKQILNGDVSVMVLPIPLNTACNRAVTTTHEKFVESCDIAKLAIAVWRVDQVKFREFHEAMFADEQPPTYAQATVIAKSIVDSAKLEDELASGIPGKFVSSMVQLYEKSGKGTVPKLMFPGTSIVGEFTSAEALADVIKQQAK